MRTIRVKDFAEFPGGRFKRYGTNSGEEFRECVLVKALDTSGNERLEIDLSDVFTYQPSFLDEAFAGLVSSGRVTLEEFKRRFVFKADRANKPYVDMIMRYVNEAAKGRSGATPAH